MSYALNLSKLAKLPHSFSRKNPLSGPVCTCDLKRTVYDSASSREKDGSNQTKQIRLRGLPTTATPSDIRRMARNVDKNGTLSNITDIKLDYWRFSPTGRAYIELNDSYHTDAALRLLNKATLSALPVKANKGNQVPLHGTRKRGVKGRAEAAERAVLDGNGPGGAVSPKGCDVVVSGLPGATTGPALRLYLGRIEMVGANDAGQPNCEVVKIPIPKRGYSLTSKFFIRLNSVAEAHAFVRRMHMTYFFPEVWGSKFLIRARVIY